MNDDDRDLAVICEEQKQQIEQLRDSLAASEDKLARLTTCRRCGLAVSEEPMAVTDDVKKTYFKSLLTGKAFQKTYELFGGVVTVLFEMPKGTLLSAQRTALTSAKKDANITSINDIVLLASLVRIDICDEDDDDTVCAYEKSYEQRESLLLDAENSIKELEASCDYALLSCVRDALMSFGTLIKAISETGLDKNFYEGAGLR